MSDDFLDGLPGDDTSGQSRRVWHRKFDLPTSKVRAVRDDEPSEYVKAGRYLRKTITLLPEQIEYIDQIRKEADVGVLEMYRWLIDQGLQQWEKGERPIGRTVATVEMGHWSSKRE